MKKENETLHKDNEWLKSEVARLALELKKATEVVTQMDLGATGASSMGAELSSMTAPAAFTMSGTAHQHLPMQTPRPASRVLVGVPPSSVAASQVRLLLMWVEAVGPKQIERTCTSRYSS